LISCFLNSLKRHWVPIHIRAMHLTCVQAPNVKLFNATAAEDLIVKPDSSVPGGK